VTETYRWRGGCEQLLRKGAGSPVALLVLPALFEEANKMRRFTVSLMRNLAALGIETVLPDLPGTGESLTDLIDVQFDDWQDAVSALIGSCMGSVAIRGGALLDESSQHRWHLAPESGERMVRDMVRATAFSEGVPIGTIYESARETPTRLAGNLLNPRFFGDLTNAVPTMQAHVTMVEGQKLWRAAEPADDPDFAAMCATDILAWTKICAA
jgi:hypothetical protein